MMLTTFCASAFNFAVFGCRSWADGGTEESSKIAMTSGLIVKTSGCFAVLVFPVDQAS
jgi:hypothetical protein